MWTRCAILKDILTYRLVYTLQHVLYYYYYYYFLICIEVMISSTFFCLASLVLDLSIALGSYIKETLFCQQFRTTPAPLKAHFDLTIFLFKIYWGCVCFPSHYVDFWARQCFGRIRDTSLTHSITLFL